MYMEGPFDLLFRATDNYLQGLTFLDTPQEKPLSLERPCRGLPLTLRWLSASKPNLEIDMSAISSLELLVSNRALQSTFGLVHGHTPSRAVAPKTVFWMHGPVGTAPEQLTLGLFWVVLRMGCILHNQHSSSSCTQQRKSQM